MTQLAQNPLYQAFIGQIDDKLAANNGALLAQVEAMLRPLCAAIGKQPALTPAIACPVGGTCPPIPEDACMNNYVPLLQTLIRKRCDLMFDPCDVKRVADAIADGAWPLYEDQAGRSEMSFQLTGAIGTGQAQTTPPSNTIFVAGPTIPASRSLLVVQDLRYSLPWRPGCLDIDIQPADGVTKEQAFSNLLVTAWVALARDLANLNTDDPAQPVGYYGELWNDYQVIRGKELYCGTNCQKVALRGPCVDGDWVGKDAVLLLQIDNLDAANSITFRNAEVDFKHVKKICCDACFAGKSCGCGG